MAYQSPSGTHNRLPTASGIYYSHGWATPCLLYLENNDPELRGVHGIPVTWLGSLSSFPRPGNAAARSLISDICAAPRDPVAFNSLAQSGGILRQRYCSTVAQIMACCLTAPSHHLNPMLIWDYWYPSQSNFTENVWDTLAKIIIQINVVKDFPMSYCNHDDEIPVQFKFKFFIVSGATYPWKP